MARPLRFTGGTQQVMIRVPKEQYEQLREISERDGVPIAEQIRRALTAHVEGRGLTPAKPKPELRKGKRARGVRSVKPVSLSPKHAIDTD
jgi:ribbon-helix-helix protein